MEWRILFLGPVGAGKTEAIKTISDIEVVSTEEEATNETALLKTNTTVAMDMGVMKLSDEDRVILYGAPGQDRFSFMWEILLEQTQGVVVLVNHSHPEALDTLAHYIGALREMCFGSVPPVVVGITHADLRPEVPLSTYRDWLGQHATDLGGTRLPVFTTDARQRRDVRNLLLALTAMLEFDERLTAQMNG